MKVTPENFVRVETNKNFQTYNDVVGGTNRLWHKREFGGVNTSVRFNFDTLYSIAILDLSVGNIMVTLPDSKSKRSGTKRWMATQVLNQDHMTNPEYFTTAPASFEVTKEKMRTRYSILIIRTEVFDGSDPEDIKEINKLQDLIKISHENQGKLEIPEFDKATYQTTKNAVQALSDSWGELDGFDGLGWYDSVNPIKHLCITLTGTFGMPPFAAVYYTRTVEDSSKEYRIRVKDVPSEAMWSVTIYDKLGYFPKEEGHYNAMCRRMKKDKDGFFTINFKFGKSADYNTLTIFEGWNYTVRIYSPKQNVQDQQWKFPMHEILKSSNF